MPLGGVSPIDGTLLLPDMYLFHEDSEFCWCEPEVIEHDDWTEVIHNFPDH